MSSQASTSSQLLVDNVTFSYGPSTILDSVSFTLAPDDRLGIIGPNGSGKSTLLKLLAGQLHPDSGSISLIPTGGSIGMVTQQLDDRPGESIIELLERRTGLGQALAEFEAATRSMADGSAAANDRYDQALKRYLATEPDTFEARLDAAMAAVGLASLDRSQSTNLLSGGQRTKLNLASVALSVHNVLLLDEPTNDLDAAGLEALETMLDQRHGPFIVVSHDRAFLDVAVTSVLELDAHSRRATRYHGGFQAWQVERARAQQHEQERYAQFSQTKAQLEAQTDRMQRWATKGRNRAKHRDEPDKNIKSGKIERAEAMGGRASAANQALQRLERVDKPFEPWVLRLRFAEAKRTAERVAALQGAVVRRGSFTLGPVDLEVGWGERVLITGANGAGKTTLLHALLGILALDAGTCHVAAKAEIGRLDQHREPFGDVACLLDGFMAATGLTFSEARSQLAKLGLDGDKISRPTSELSPGEQTRAVLGVFAATGINVLVLDEPTNHLDLEAIEELESALQLFKGTILLVSHDRRLIASFLGSSTTSSPSPSSPSPQPGLKRMTRRLVVDRGAVSEG